MYQQLGSIADFLHCLFVHIELLDDLNYIISFFVLRIKIYKRTWQNDALTPYICLHWSSADHIIFGVVDVVVVWDVIAVVTVDITVSGFVVVVGVIVVIVVVVEFDFVVVVVAVVVDGTIVVIVVVVEFDFVVVVVEAVAFKILN